MKTKASDILDLFEEEGLTQQLARWQAANDDWRSQIRYHHLGAPNNVPEEIAPLVRVVRNSVTCSAEGWPEVEWDGTHACTVCGADYESEDPDPIQNYCSKGCWLSDGGAQ